MRPADRPAHVPLEDGADLSALDGAKIFTAPEYPGDRPAWRTALARWRDQARVPAPAPAPRYPAWTRGCFSVCVAWLWDETLYDPERGVFTPGAFLRHGVREFGGYDAVVLWHAYPVIGLDGRDQFRFYRDMPGVAELVAALRRHGVRVLLDYNPWAAGGEPHAESLAALVADLGADGVFLDTMRAGGPALRAALGPYVALESESAVPLAGVASHAMSWAQWFGDSATPGVLRTKWFERSHLLHHTRRWHRDHSAELHSAWMNGCGVLVWENVFGSWVGWNARDRALLRAMLPVQRRFAELFRSGEWTPLVDEAAPGLPASRELTITYRVRECGFDDGAPYVDAWKPLPPDLHGIHTVRRRARLRPVAVAAREVTNVEYETFVRAAGYSPRHPERFLDPARDTRPDAAVTCVDLDDARAYADDGVRTPEHTLKLLRTHPAIERSAAVGFRCAADLEDS